MPLAYYGDEDIDRAGTILAVDSCAINRSNSDPAVSSIVDNGKVQIIDFNAGFENGDDLPLLQT